MSSLSLLHWRRRRGRRARRGRPGGAGTGLFGGGALGEHLAAEDPHLAADLPVRRPRLGKSVVDVRAQRVQRHAPLAVPLVPGHLGAAQPAGAGHADALGAELLRRLDGLLHRAAESDAPLELGGDVLRDQLRVGLGLADLDDVEEHLVLRELLQLLLDLLDARTALADDDARPRGVHVDLHLVGGALDLDLADTGLAQLLLHVLAQLDVLVQPARVVLLLVPLGVPGADDAQAEADRIDLLTHLFSLGNTIQWCPPESYPFACGARAFFAGFLRPGASSPTTMKTWLVFFSTLNARPMARGMKRRSEGPCPTCRSVT